MRFHSLLSSFLAGCLAPVLAAATLGGTLRLSTNAPEFTFEYSTPNANAKNWIGIYHASGGGPENDKQDQPSLRWEYAPNAQGTVKISPPVGASGQYKAYFLANDGYKWLAEPVIVTAKGNSSGDPSELKIMTFNLWHGGVKVNGYHDKQVKFIREQNLDAVGLQEATGDHAKRLGEALGWNYHQSDGENTVGIISRHRIAERHANINSRTSGVQINLNDDSNKAINFWSTHLNAYPYGPYKFCFEKKSAAEVTEDEMISGRTGQITEIIEKTTPQRSDSKPFILVGDFNAPSHLDWTPNNRHCGVSYDWPTSKIPTDAGLIDSYRVANPDPTVGNTWSPIYKQNTDVNAAEPMDRIDFIYHTNKLQVLKSEIKVAGTPKFEPDHADNEWTSDHAVVITTYKMP